MTSKPRKQTPMASKAEQLPEVPPVRDEAAELAAQLAATQESGESAAAPAAEDDGDPCESEAPEGAAYCVLPAGHADLHSDGEGVTWSDVVSPDPDAVEGEIVPDDAPICGECFPGGWKRRNPAATMCSCRHGEWHRSAEG